MSSILNTILIDDDADHLELLREHIKALDLPVNIIGEARNAASGLQLIRSAKPDVVFLDIEMPGGSGLDLMMALPDRNFEVILITAHPGHMHEALHQHAFDYLLKPVDPLQLTRAVNAAVSKIVKGTVPQAQVPGRLAVALREGIIFLDIPEIVRCEADNVYTTIVLVPGKKIVSSKPLKDFDERLHSHGFIRVHRSHLINPAHIVRYVRGEAATLEMRDGATVPVSPSFKEELHRALDLR